MMPNAVFYFFALLTPMVFALEKYVTLHSGLKMPILGYGTYDSYDDKLEKALEIALNAGYRHIDTASIYNNEEAIGRVLNRYLTNGKLKRSDLFLVTKLPGVGMHPLRVSKFLKESLSKLQVDYVDLYLIHSPDGLNYKEGTYFPKTPEGDLDIDYNTDHVAIWKAMEDQVTAGLTKSIGLSNYQINLIDKILKNCTIQPDNHQIEIHAYFQQNELVDYCKNHNISLTAYSPLGAPGLPKLNPGSIVPKLLSDPVVNKIAKKHTKSSAQILLRHIVQKGIAAIPKSSTESRIIENINIFDFELDDKDMKELNALDKGPEGGIVYNDFP